MKDGPKPRRPPDGKHGTIGNLSWESVEASIKEGNYLTPNNKKISAQMKVRKYSELDIDAMIDSGYLHEITKNVKGHGKVRWWGRDSDGSKRYCTFEYFEHREIKWQFVAASIKLD